VTQCLLDPSFLCRKHTLLKAREHPLQKIDTIHAMENDPNYSVWTWARQDVERNFSILDAHKGIFTLPEKQSVGGRVFCMTSTGEVDKRIWIGTAVSVLLLSNYNVNILLYVNRTMRFKYLVLLREWQILSVFGHIP